jgi:hypothetical protein
MRTIVCEGDMPDPMYSILRVLPAVPAVGAMLWARRL